MEGDREQMQRVKKGKPASTLESSLMPCYAFVGRALHFFVLSEQQNTFLHTFSITATFGRKRGIKKGGVSSILGLGFLSRLITTDGV